MALLCFGCLEREKRGFDGISGLPIFPYGTAYYKGSHTNQIESVIMIKPDMGGGGGVGFSGLVITTP